MPQDKKNTDRDRWDRDLVGTTHQGATKQSHQRLFGKGAKMSPAEDTRGMRIEEGTGKFGISSPDEFAMAQRPRAAGYQKDIALKPEPTRAVAKKSPSRRPTR